MSEEEEFSEEEEEEEEQEGSSEEGEEEEEVEKDEPKGSQLDAINSDLDSLGIDIAVKFGSNFSSLSFPSSNLYSSSYKNNTYNNQQPSFKNRYESKYTYGRKQPAPRDLFTKKQPREIRENELQSGNFEHKSSIRDSGLKVNSAVPGRYGGNGARDDKFVDTQKLGSFRNTKDFGGQTTDANQMNSRFNFKQKRELLTDNESNRSFSKEYRQKRDIIDNPENSFQRDRRRGPKLGGGGYREEEFVNERRRSNDRGREMGNFGGSRKGGRGGGDKSLYKKSIHDLYKRKQKPGNSFL